MDIEYELYEVRRIKRRIRTLNIDIESLRQCLFPSGISYDGVNVQTSPTERMSEIISEIDIKERLLDEYLKKLQVSIERVTGIINELPEGKYRDVLMLWFIGGKTAEEIRSIVDYAELSSVYKAKRKAIRQLSLLDISGQ